MVYASLEIIRTLITFNNQYEFNRVLRQKSDFFNCLDYLVIHTEFIAVIEKIFRQKMPTYESNNQDVSILFDSAIEILLVVVEYIDLKKEKAKAQNKIRKAELWSEKKKAEQEAKKAVQDVEMNAPVEEVVVE